MHQAGKQSEARRSSASNTFRPLLVATWPHGHADWLVRVPACPFD